jgi:hypothetical protein
VRQNRKRWEEERAERLLCGRARREEGGRGAVEEEEKD